MSVIAKMQFNGSLDFGSGSVSKLSCVCENDLMAAYAKSEEDRLFTKYSPWGEMKIGYGFKDFKAGDKFYVIALRGMAKPACPEATHLHRARCHVIHDYGSSKQVELKADGPFSGAMIGGDSVQSTELDWRMTIDNPPAVAFFEPGKHDYWVAFYDAEKYDRDQALALAHT